MKISKLIETLQHAKENHGDLPISIETGSVFHVDVHPCLGDFIVDAPDAKPDWLLLSILSMEEL